MESERCSYQYAEFLFVPKNNVLVPHAASGSGIEITMLINEKELTTLGDSRILAEKKELEG